jgi:hypothetical protein
MTEVVRDLRQKISSLIYAVFYKKVASQWPNAGVFAQASTLAHIAVRKYTTIKKVAAL